jgi:hypothetical protein
LPEELTIQVGPVQRIYKKEIKGSDLSKEGLKSIEDVLGNSYLFGGSKGFRETLVNNTLVYRGYKHPEIYEDIEPEILRALIGGEIIDEGGLTTSL